VERFGPRTRAIEALLAEVSSARWLQPDAALDAPGPAHTWIEHLIDELLRRMQPLLAPCVPVRTVIPQSFASIADEWRASDQAASCFATARSGSRTWAGSRRRSRSMVPFTATDRCSR